MGLLTGLLTLPLAPLRGTMRLAEQLAAQAEDELYGEASLRRQLVEAERDLDLGRLTPEEFEALEDDLLDRLEAARTAGMPATGYDP